ncbi:MAG: hypothetical protein KGL39_55125, partial [Patescibacteria group bacterium]|nr:hypothetical protein [Patescibacteria group bacterium]
APGALTALIRERGGFLSLWDILELMKELNIATISDVFAFIGFLERHINVPGVTGEPRVERGSVPIDAFIGLCSHLGLPCSLRDATALIQALRSPDQRRIEVDHLLVSLRDDFRTEADARKFFALDPDSARLLADTFSGWNAAIKKWPDIHYDVDHATRSLALNEWTACVFHLCRIAERCMRQSCQRYIPAAYLPKGRGKSMGNYAAAIDNYFRLNPGAEAEQELKEVAAHLKRIQEVWRDKVCHTGANYDAEQARRCYDGVRDMLAICAAIT